MFDTITIVLVLLTLSAVAAAGFAVAYLSRIKKNLSELGMRVLESEDVGRIKEAANKAGSYESRVAGCEQKTDESKNQLAELKTKLNELSEKLRAYEQKMESFEARFNELSTKLESVEQMTNRNENGLAQTVPNIKALADEIQSLKVFQSATEKARNLIIDAFNDMQTSMSSDEAVMMQPKIPTPEEITSEASIPEQVTPEDEKTEEALKGLEDWQNEKEPPRVTGSRRWQS